MLVRIAIFLEVLDPTCQNLVDELLRAGRDGAISMEKAGCKGGEQALAEPGVYCQGCALPPDVPTLLLARSPDDVFIPGHKPHPGAVRRLQGDIRRGQGLQPSPSQVIVLYIGVSGGATGFRMDAKTQASNDQFFTDVFLFARSPPMLKYVFMTKGQIEEGCAKLQALDEKLDTKIYALPYTQASYLVEGLAAAVMIPNAEDPFLNVAPLGESVAGASQKVFEAVADMAWRQARSVAGYDNLDDAARRRAFEDARQAVLLLPAKPFLFAQCDEACMQVFQLVVQQDIYKFGEVGVTGEGMSLLTFTSAMQAHLGRQGTGGTFEQHSANGKASSTTARVAADKGQAAVRSQSGLNGQHAASSIFNDPAVASAAATGNSGNPGGNATGAAKADPKDCAFECRMPLCRRKKPFTTALKVKCGQRKGKGKGALECTCSYFTVVPEMEDVAMKQLSAVHDAYVFFGSDPPGKVTGAQKAALSAFDALTAAEQHKDTRLLTLAERGRHVKGRLLHINKMVVFTSVAGTLTGKADPWEPPEPGTKPAPKPAAKRPEPMSEPAGKPDPKRQK